MLIAADILYHMLIFGIDVGMWRIAVFVSSAASAMPSSAPNGQRTTQLLHPSGAFNQALTGYVGNFRQASEETQGLIEALRDYQDLPSASWRYGVWDVHVEDMAEGRDRALRAFTQAATALFRDYDIDTNQAISFALEPNGAISVTSDHPHRMRIEALINGSSYLRGAAANVLSLSHLVNKASMVDASPEQLNDMKRGLSLRLESRAGGMVGLVKLHDRVLASSRTDAETTAKQQAFTDALREFEEDEQRRADERQKEDERLKVQEAEKLHHARSEQREEVADLMADQEAAERMARLHPELGHRAVFI